MKNSMLKALETLLDKQDFEYSGPDDSSHTLQVKELCLDSSLEVTKQIKFTAALLEFREKITYLLPVFTLMTAYQKCPKDNLLVLHSLIKKEISLNEAWAAELNETAYSLSDKSNGNCDSYKRFYPEHYKPNYDDIMNSNSKTVLLFHELVKSFVSHNSASNNTNSLSAMNYSKAVKSGVLADEFDEYPILKHCETYLEIIDKYIELAIISATTMDDNVVCNIMQLLNWRCRFIGKISEPIIYADKKRKILRMEDVVPLMYIHSKWLQKHLMGGLFKLLPDNNKFSSMFKNEVSIVRQQFKDNSEMAKLGKKLRKLYGQPNLYESEEQYDLSKAKSKVYESVSLDMNQPIDKQISRLSADITSLTDVSLALDVPEQNVLAQIQENIVRTTEVKDSMKLGPEVKLMPINSYVIQRILNLLQGDFLKIIKILSSDDKRDTTKYVIYHNDFMVVLTNLVHLGKESKVFSPVLLNLLQVIQKLLHGDDSIRKK